MKPLKAAEYAAGLALLALALTWVSFAVVMYVRI